MPQSELFTASSFVNLAGASAGVFVVCGALQAALNFNPRWLALVMSEIVAVFGMYEAHSAAVPSDYFIAVLNGCLIYCTAVGGSTLGSTGKLIGRAKGRVGLNGINERRAFLSNWF
jgi:hypothetical protein